MYKLNCFQIFIDHLERVYQLISIDLIDVFLILLVMYQFFTEGQGGKLISDTRNHWKSRVIKGENFISDTRNHWKSLETTENHWESLETTRNQGLETMHFCGFGRRRDLNVYQMKITNNHTHTHTNTLDTFAIGRTDKMVVTAGRTK